MKNIFYLTTFLLALVVFTACEEEERDLANNSKILSDDNKDKFEERKSDLYPIVGDFVQYKTDNRLDGRVLRIFENGTLKFGQIEHNINTSEKFIKFYRKGTWNGNTFKLNGGNIYKNAFQEVPNTNNNEFYFNFIGELSPSNYIRVDNFENEKYNVKIIDTSDDLLQNGFITRNWSSLNKGNSGWDFSQNKISYRSIRRHVDGYNYELVAKNCENHKCAIPFNRKDFVIKAPNYKVLNHINQTVDLEIEIFFWGNKMGNSNMIFFHGLATYINYEIGTKNIISTRKEIISGSK